MPEIGEFHGKLKWSDFQAMHQKLSRKALVRLLGDKDRQLAHEQDVFIALGNADVKEFGAPEAKQHHLREQGRTIEKLKREVASLEKQTDVNS